MFDDFESTLLLGWLAAMFILVAGPYICDAVKKWRSR